MNAAPPGPPPVPPGKGTKSLAHQAALGSLLAPLLAVLVVAAVRAAWDTKPTAAAGMLVGGFAVLLIAAGLALAIIGLCGIREHGTRGILGRSIAGLLINGVLFIAFAVAFAS